jgi:CubicO group peptidase (beta-lactamase class C family)
MKRDSFYGLNWFVYTDKFRPVGPPFSSGAFYHGGTDGTLAFADPSHNLIVVYGTQSRFTDTTADFVRRVYAALVK